MIGALIIIVWFLIGWYIGGKVFDYWWKRKKEDDE